MVVSNENWVKNPVGTTNRIKKYITLVMIFVIIDVIACSIILIGHEISLYILSLLGVMNFVCIIFILFSEMHNYDTPRYYQLLREGICFKIGGGKERKILWGEIEWIFMNGRGVDYWNFLKKDGTKEVIKISKEIGEKIQKQFQLISETSKPISYIITPKLKILSEIPEERKEILLKSKFYSNLIFIGIIIWVVCSIFLYFLSNYGYSLTLKIVVIFTGIPGTLLILHGIMKKLEYKNKIQSLKTSE